MVLSFLSENQLHSGWSVLPEAASRRPGWTEKKVRRAADRTSAAGGQAMDGLSAGLGGQPIRPQSSSWRQNRPAFPTTMPISVVRGDLQS